MNKKLEWKNKRCIILDMDGTVYLGGIPIKGAVEFIKKRWQDADFYFLSNNTSKSVGTYVARLNEMGILAEEKHILSPVVPLADFLRLHSIKCIYPVGNTDFKDDLKKRMPYLEFSSKNAAAVVLAYDTELTYKKLAESALLLQKPEVLFLATHPDNVCPSPYGPLPDVGSFIKLYEKAAGRSPQFIFGKPEPKVLEPLFALYDKSEMIMVGDRLSTDKKLAENAGIDFALVLSGEATLKDLEKETLQPAAVLEHLGCAEW